MIETGALDHLLKSWVGRGLPVNKESEKMVLSAGQVFLVFGIMLLTIGTVCCILVCEVVNKKFTTEMKDGIFKFVCLEVNVGIDVTSMINQQLDNIGVSHESCS